MSAIYKQKRQFVQELLRPAIFQANPDIRGVDYSKRAPDSDEIVTITYVNDYTKHINVTGDSYNAMMRDVLAHLD